MAESSGTVGGGCTDRDAQKQLDVVSVSAGTLSSPACIIPLADLIPPSRLLCLPAECTTIQQNEVMKEVLSASGVVRVMASEEDDGPIEVPPNGDLNQQGGFAVVFDPLDGSRSVPALRVITHKRHKIPL